MHKVIKIIAIGVDVVCLALHDIFDECRTLLTKLVEDAGSLAQQELSKCYELVCNL